MTTCGCGEPVAYVVDGEPCCTQHAMERVFTRGPAAVDREREAMRARGFLGEPVPGDAPTYTDGPHSLTVRLYRYPDCADPRPFVEVWESHDGAREARIYPLSEVVHLLQNVTEREFYVLGGREEQGRARRVEERIVALDVAIGLVRDVLPELTPRLRETIETLMRMRDELLKARAGEDPR